MSHRVPLVRRSLLMLALAGLSAGAWAQTAPRATATPAATPSWPTKPVRIVVGFPAGSSPDLTARTLAEPLSQMLGQPVIVENKPGAGTVIGVDFASKQPADGYNFAVGEVVHIAYLGDLSIYHVRLKSGQMISAQLQNEHRYQKGLPTWGDEVRLCWEADSCVVLTV